MSNSELEILNKTLWAERCIKKYPSLYNNILEFNKDYNLPFKVKVYNYYYNIESIPTCKSCDNKVKFYNGSYSTYCGNKCANNDPEFKLLREKTMLEKYGLKSLIGTKETRSKIINTNIERYGFDISSKSEIVKKKISDTKKNISDKENEEINNKRKSTNINKYGVDNVSKSEVIKQRTIENNLNKWGYEFPIMSKEVSDKRKNNYIDKTGQDHHFKFDDILKKMQRSRKKTMTKKYLDKLSSIGLKVINYNDGNVDILCTNCNKEYNIVIYVLYQRIHSNRLICTNCNPLYNKTSSYQSEITNIIESYNIEYVKNDRKILDGREIDIYIPSLKLAIEINGLYWHSEIYKTRSYHLDKTLLCQEKGINLIHIWEDDWIYKKEIVKSIILNRLGKITNKIFSRKCSISEVSSSDSRKFLDDNHIQGYSSSQKKLGLYYNNELVSLMTFGWRYTNGKKEYELIRFCNKINVNVIGSASKLFKHLIKTEKVDEIISYSDMAMFDGGMYSKLGFEYVSLSSPNYFWVIDGIRKHRFNFNKKKLIKEGFDPNKSEVEIMHERGYYRIWGCGQKKWIYYSNNI